MKGVRCCVRWKIGSRHHGHCATIRSCYWKFLRPTCDAPLFALSVLRHRKSFQMASESQHVASHIYPVVNPVLKIAMSSGSLTPISTDTPSEKQPVARPCYPVVTRVVKLVIFSGHIASVSTYTHGMNGLLSAPFTLLLPML